VKVEIDVVPVGYIDTISRILDFLRFDIGELLEERGDVEDDGGTNEVDALGADETGREEVKIVGDGISLYRVAGIMSALY
jgi:hypothetical protein